MNILSFIRLSKIQQCESDCLSLQMYCIMPATPRDQDYSANSSCVLEHHLNGNSCLPKDNFIESFCLK